ncbi:TIGR03750 family conjugal transfer protein [Halomonas sp. McH1-25]|uniref:TIGR03750 family conjugal transfer protein n=1 Tax=unclassified Halomonas TaxID=2609666 RepID=UPI001EF691AA|nr:MULTISPECIES: TIGR03750 family conjugal transfer protein [unclassified Halomonas]MCG7601781.1 TIGR03750 family conjugal transfer protein [Halomonas sp. McH1-25]MCP1343957.1 TIGR03750 family conjugal transfer protein [Halomonas sp. FL8]MCP1361810.1 TIGR03750 family conjugal transfer protein [Halomonas sp. BBD45]MCP1366569.1 TIGR03750 family conjugal transfer protein [Halomonas sp. BBD48]
MASIYFIPRRINDPPVVFRGMTLREVGIMAVTGFLVGLLPGIALAVVMGMPAMAPTVAVALMAGALGVGGTIMRRLRRGRPSSLLYRQITYKLASQGFALGGERLITRSSVYRVGREPRRKGGLR